jgi:hypothetical protein
MLNAFVFLRQHGSGHISARGWDGDIRARGKTVGGSGGTRTGGTGQVGEGIGHTLDPAKSAVQSATGKPRDRRSKGSLSIQF